MTGFNRFFHSLSAIIVKIEEWALVEGIGECVCNKFLILVDNENDCRFVNRTGVT